LAGKPRTVLVTGGAGYIGSHAAKALSRAGYQVVVFDNLVAGHAEAVKYGELVVGDITNVAAVGAALERYDVGAVMHFAAYLDVGESVREPIKYYRNNVVGALSVLEAMAARSVKCFVFSSTCATYGEPTETPIAETHRQHPINAYGETKLVVERSLPHFERAYGIRSVALRYFLRRAPTRTARSARIMRRKSISSPVRSTPRPADAGCRCSGTITRHRMEPACAITFT
jgi:UDP-glucose 4-epimerase